MIDKESVAEMLYEAYCREVGGVAFNGDSLPSWDEFADDPNKVKQANAWRKVADIALNLYESTGELDE